VVDADRGAADAIDEGRAELGELARGSKRAQPPVTPG
jgi:hypothetical protein